MRQQTIYCCEFCDKRYMEQADCEEHEATHFGLSWREYLDWRVLWKQTAHAGRMCGCSNDEKSRENFDDWVAKLTDFEVRHNLTSFHDKPSDFY